MHQASGTTGDMSHGSKISTRAKSKTEENKPYRHGKCPVSASLRKIERVYDKDNKGLHRHEAKRQRERSQHTPFDESSSRTVSTETFEDR